MVSVNTRTRLFEGLRHTSSVSTHLYLVRHGQTAANVRQQLVGHTDIPLDELGQHQARQVGKRMQSVTLDAIVSSPLMRATSTAMEIARHQQVEIVTDDRLREMNFGHAEGLTMVEAIDRFPELMALQRDPLDNEFGWPGGDVRNDFHSRVMTAFTEIAMSHQDRHVAVVCHGGVIGSVIAQLDGGSPNDYTNYPIANCSITHLEVHATGTTAHLLNEIGHLEVVDIKPFTVTISTND